MKSAYDSSWLPVNAPARSRLENLPMELLWTIVDELDDVTKLCLRSTCSTLRRATNVDFAKLSVCSKWLALCRFEMDYYAVMDAYPRRVACAFCKMTVDQKCFNPKNTIRGKGCEVLDLMGNTPTERFCILHAERLFRLGEVFRKRQTDKPRKWTKKSQLTCMHCGTDVAADDQRPAGCDGCGCDVCPRALQPRYEFSGHVSFPYLVIFSLRHEHYKKFSIEGPGKLLAWPGV